MKSIFASAVELLGLAGGVLAKSVGVRVGQFLQEKLEKDNIQWVLLASFTTMLVSIG